ncbi:MAG: FkbM family methyltransferase [Candidatus Desulfofervidaceae bacterium]|nr:FkbM family methyltransferase [Candidatus Desulfofervidaceae bacterium]
MELKEKVKFYEKFLKEEYMKKGYVFFTNVPVALYGAGTLGEQWLRFFRNIGVNVLFFIDDFKEGELDGIPIINFKEFLERKKQIGHLYITVGDFEVAKRIKKKIEREFKHIKEICVLNQFVDYEDLKCRCKFQAISEKFAEEYYSYEAVYKILSDKYSKELFSMIIALANFLNSRLDFKVDILILQKIFSEFISKYEKNLYDESLFLYPEREIHLKKGDIVIECGGIMGHDTKFFAELVGETGRIFVFEEPSFFSILKQSIKHLPNVVFFEINFRKFSIDDFFKKEKPEKLSFIKIDTGGFEKEILLKAKNTIRDFRPKLAISLYHKSEFLYEIPLLVKEFVPEYKIFLKQNEPVFFEGLKLFSTI